MKSAEFASQLGAASGGPQRDAALLSSSSLPLPPIPVCVRISFVPSLQLELAVGYVLSPRSLQLPFIQYFTQVLHLAISGSRPALFFSNHRFALFKSIQSRLLLKRNPEMEGEQAKSIPFVLCRPFVLSVFFLPPYLPSFLLLHIY